MSDDYIRQTAEYIQRNESRLAQATFIKPRISSSSWFSFNNAPLVFTTDSHHLFYLFIRLEALGLPVGSLDILLDSPSRPLVYLPHQYSSDTTSLFSFRSSLSAVSNLSLAAPWWPRFNVLSPDDDLRFIYSTFTKLPALKIVAPKPTTISELVDDPPTNNAVPLDTFKNLQVFECDDVDPRAFLGWDRLAESLRSLKISSSGLQDISQVLISAVLEDQDRRQNPANHSRNRTLVPVHAPSDPHSPTPTSPPTLSPLKWAFLRHLFLPNNQLTFLSPELLQHLTSLAHLDLSSNLFVSIPPGLAILPKLQSLNMSDNLIDSVLGVYLNLGQILYLNLSRNRLESLCGLERLLALERVDIRANLLDESAEVGRLVDLPNISHLWVEGNPFTEIEANYRVTLFNRFRKPGSNIVLDGSQPGYYEKQFLLTPPDALPSSQPSTSTYSPPVIAVGQHRPHPSISPVPERDTAPYVVKSHRSGASRTAPKRKTTRIVELEQTPFASENLNFLLPPQESLGETSRSLPRSSLNPTQPRSHHARHRTEVRDPADDPQEPKRASRRARVSASVFEAPPSSFLESKGGGGTQEDYRRTIEDLQKDMGEGWLKVYSQSQSVAPS